jgi:hypothetical protein
MNKKNTKPARFDDVQIEAGALKDLGERIAAHLKKVREYEATAREKAGVELQKAQDNRDSIAQLLAEAKAKCRDLGFKAFKEKYCPDLGKTRLYELLAIGDGRNTPEKINAAANERKKRHREASATVRSTTDGTDKPEAVKVSLENSEALPSLDVFDDRAKEQLDAAAGDNTPPKAEVAPSVSDVKAFTDSPALKSARALAAGKSALDDLLPDMSPADRSALYAYFVFHPKMVGIKRRAA